MHLITKLANRTHLEEAWRQIEHKPESCGLDLLTISDFADGLTRNILKIGRELRSGKYGFTKLKGHGIPKEGSSPRALRIPAVRDRVVQKGIALLIQPTLTTKYNLINPTSFGYIAGRSPIDAIKRVRELYLAGYNWVYIADIKKFFDSIPRQQLVDEFVFPVLRDDTLNDLISSALNCEIGNYKDMAEAGWGSEFLSTDVGIPQGSILSPLFANVYLSPLDQAILSSDYQMVRYADDFVVMCRSEADAINSYELAKSILEDKLGLSLHPLNSDKSRIERFNILEFLGVRFQGKHVFPGTKNVRKMRELLDKFGKKPPKGTLLSNLNHLREKTSFWGAMYFYTSLDSQTYEHLDNALANVVAKILSRYGFVTKRPPLGAEQLEILGVPTFSKSVHLAKARRMHQFNNFYDADARSAQAAAA